MTLDRAVTTPDPRESPLRIVAIGGGTGLSALLHGLKQYTHPCPDTHAPQVEIAAIVTVTDDGGSSGRLRRDFQVLPPGDIRNCMVALSEDAALLGRLFQYRFERGRGLKGHSFGNLFLTALTAVTGDFAQAVRVSSEVLAIAGRIFPATAANVVLEATLENGKTIAGETRISRSRSRIRQIRLIPPDCEPIEETLEALAAADLITLGPGSLFTSVVPNLLVRGIADAIAASPALKAAIVNLMWQPGETTDFSAADHIAAMEEHAGRHFIDCAVTNTRPIGPEMLSRYEQEFARPVENDVARLERMGLKVLGRDLLREAGKVRHSPEALAAVVVELAGLSRRRGSGATP
jgi:uncharacterized cofD-like protein